MSKQRSTWCFWSTYESVENEVLSVTAILETIIAIPIYWWIALQVGTVLPLLISAAVAPLVLLRSEPSVALGLQWFKKFEENIKTEIEYRNLPLAKQFIVWVVVALSVAISLCTVV